MGEGKKVGTESKHRRPGVSIVTQRKRNNAVSAAWLSGEQLLELPGALDESQAEFLRQEHEYLGRALLANEESGERRVSLFVGLIAAATAGIGLGADAIRADRSLLVGAVAVLAAAVLMFGLATLRRVMDRNLETTEFINRRRLVGASHILRDPAALEVFPFVAGQDPEIRKKDDFSWGKAGYLEIIALANCALVVVGATALVGLVGQQVAVAATVGLFGGAVAWVGQIEWAGRVYARETCKRARLRHEAVEWWRRAIAGRSERFRAGVGLVVIRSDQKVLMLERSDVPSAWQLPQGGINLGEDSEEAAWRELREEVGLTREHVTLEAVSDVWLGYELPPEYRRAKTGRGQTHRWHVFRLREDTKPPALPACEGAEFRAQRWVDPGSIATAAASFRRPEYREVVKWLESLSAGNSGE
jgi:putative (di)nucleoside polyphosphate hydrolase